MTSFSELKKLGSSELVYGEKVHLKHNKKTVLWAWKIKCGICKSEVQLRLDSSLKGRISYFQARKWHFMHAIPSLFTLLLIIYTRQGRLYRTSKMNESRQHNIRYTKLISVVFYILMRIAAQEWTSYLKIALQFNDFDSRSTRCYFKVSTSLLDHFKSCQSKAKKTPQRQQTLLGMLNRKRKLSEEGTSNEGSAQLTVDSDVDVSDTEETRA